MAADAVLVNISGHVDHPRLFDTFRRRLLVDIDPGFTRFGALDGNPGARVDGRRRSSRIGELIEAPGVPGAESGIEWLLPFGSPSCSTTGP